MGGSEAMLYIALGLPAKGIEAGAVDTLALYAIELKCVELFLTYIAQGLGIVCAISVIVTSKPLLTLIWVCAGGVWPYVLWASASHAR